MSESQEATLRCRQCGRTLGSVIADGICARCRDGATPEERTPRLVAHQPPRSLPAGVVLGKVEIVRELGRGGMGAVYLGRHRKLDLPVAVKVLHPLLAQDSPRAMDRFLRESRLSARLKHPNLVSVSDADTDPQSGFAYIVMEYVPGPSVARLVADGPMNPARAVRIALGVARALELVEQSNVVHRDVKPSNILTDRGGVVKLADLGLAKDLSSDGLLTSSTATLGTPVYMSPEQLRSSIHVDIRSDVYSLGVTLYEMLTGALPFHGGTFFEIADAVSHAPVPDPRVRQPHLDPKLAGIVMRLMSKSKHDRPATPTEVVGILTEWLREAGPEEEAATDAAPTTPAQDVTGAEPPRLPSLRAASGNEDRKVGHGLDTTDRILLGALIVVIAVVVVAYLWLPPGPGR